MFTLRQTMRMGFAIAVLSYLCLFSELATATKTAAQTAPARPDVTVWSSPGCGCCEGWVDHMARAGFAVTVHLSDDIMAVKEANGVPEAMQSCHTAQVGGYVVEGHVPADLVLRLLTERPKARGIAAPGMPLGSPGMGEGPHPPYEVILFGTPAGHSRYAVR